MSSTKKRRTKAKATPHSSKDDSPTIEYATTTPTSPPDITPDSTTRVAFREFLELANLETIKLFLTTAASVPQGENLRILWARAFKEGLIAGRQLFGNTEEKLKKVHDQGYELGFREGSSSKEDLFQVGFNEGRREEQGDWLIEGHGLHCFRPTADFSMQTDLPFLVTTGVNTGPVHISSSQTQTDPPKPTPTTASTFSITSESSSQAMRPVPPSETSHERINWADDIVDITPLPILPTSPPPRDFSILRSSSKPFSSLQRRSKRSQARFSRPFHNHNPFPNQQQTHSSFRLSKPQCHNSSKPAHTKLHCTRHSTSLSALNWEDDPRLSDLSQALRALGWIRPNGGDAAMFGKGKAGAAAPGD